MKAKSKQKQKGKSKGSSTSPAQEIIPRTLTIRYDNGEKLDLFHLVRPHVLRIFGHITDEDLKIIKEAHCVTILDLENADNDTLPRDLFSGNVSFLHIFLPLKMTKLDKRLFANYTNPGIVLFQKTHFTAFRTMLTDENIMDIRSERIKTLVLTTCLNRRLEMRSFINYPFLEEIYLPKVLYSINLMCFYRCTNLRVVKISSCLFGIGDSAFSFCSSLEEIELPSSMEKLGASCFSDCTSLRRITIKAVGKDRYIKKKQNRNVSVSGNVNRSKSKNGKNGKSGRNEKNGKNGKNGKNRINGENGSGSGNTKNSNRNGNKGNENKNESEENKNRKNQKNEKKKKTEKEKRMKNSNEKKIICKEDKREIVIAKGENDHLGGNNRINHLNDKNVSSNNLLMDIVVDEVEENDNGAKALINNSNNNYDCADENDNIDVEEIREIERTAEIVNMDDIEHEDEEEEEEEEEESISSMVPNDDKSNQGEKIDLILNLDNLNRDIVEKKKKRNRKSRGKRKIAQGNIMKKGYKNINDEVDDNACENDNCENDDNRNNDDDDDNNDNNDINDINDNCNDNNNNDSDNISIYNYNNNNNNNNSNNNNNNNNLNINNNCGNIKCSYNYNDIHVYSTSMSTSTDVTKILFDEEEEIIIATSSQNNKTKEKENDPSKYKNSKSVVKSNVPVGGIIDIKERNKLAKRKAKGKKKKEVKEEDKYNSQKGIKIIGCKFLLKKRKVKINTNYLKREARRKVIVDASCRTRIRDNRMKNTLSQAKELCELPNRISSVRSFLFKNCPCLKEVILPESAIRIEERVFDNCYNLETIIIPKKVQNIATNAFVGCKCLKNLVVEKGSKFYYTDSFGCLYDKKRTTLIRFPSVLPIERKSVYKLPNTVKIVCAWSFEYSKIKVVILPLSVETIGEEAFRYSEIRTIKISFTHRDLAYDLTVVEGECNREEEEVKVKVKVKESEKEEEKKDGKVEKEGSKINSRESNKTDNRIDRESDDEINIECDGEINIECDNEISMECDNEMNTVHFDEKDEKNIGKDGRIKDGLVITTYNRNDDPGIRIINNDNDIIVEDNRVIIDGDKFIIKDDKIVADDWDDEDDEVDEKDEKDEKDEDDVDDGVESKYKANDRENAKDERNINDKNKINSNRDNKKNSNVDNKNSINDEISNDEIPKDENSFIDKMAVDNITALDNTNPRSNKTLIDNKAPLENKTPLNNKTITENKTLIENKILLENKTPTENKTIEDDIANYMYSNKRKPSYDHRIKLRKIEKNAFTHCQSLKNVCLSSISKNVIPKSIKLEEGVFSYCSSLPELYIEQDTVMTEIPKRLFYECHSLKSTNIPTKIKIIWNEAYKNCYCLEEVIFIPPKPEEEIEWVMNERQFHLRALEEIEEDEELAENNGNRPGVLSNNDTVNNSTVNNDTVNNNTVNNSVLNNSIRNNNIINGTMRNNSIVNNNVLNNTPLNNIPLNNIPLNNIPLNNTPRNNTPLNNIPLNNTPRNNTPRNNTPLNNTLLNNNTASNNPRNRYDPAKLRTLNRLLETGATTVEFIRSKFDAKLIDPLLEALEEMKKEGEFEPDVKLYNMGRPYNYSPYVVFSFKEKDKANHVPIRRAETSIVTPNKIRVITSEERKRLMLRNSGKEDEEEAEIDPFMALSESRPTNFQLDEIISEYSDEGCDEDEKEASSDIDNNNTNTDKNVRHSKSKTGARKSTKRKPEEKTINCELDVEYEPSTGTENEEEKEEVIEEIPEPDYEKYLEEQDRLFYQKYDKFLPRDENGNISLSDRMDALLEDRYSRLVKRERVYIDPYNDAYTSRTQFEHEWLMRRVFQIDKNEKEERERVNEIKKGLREIHYEAFCGCRSLKSVKMPVMTEMLGDSVFMDCVSLESVELNINNLNRINNYCFRNCSRVVEVKIPKYVRKLDSDVFAGCVNLKRLWLSEYYRENFEFNDAPLEAIYVDMENEFYCDIEGVVYNKARTRIIKFPRCKRVESYVLSDNVSEICERAFMGCFFIERIKQYYGDEKVNCVRRGDLVLKTTIVGIGDYAFKECRKLRRIEINNPDMRITPLAFSYCAGLESMKLPIEIWESSWRMRVFCESSFVYYNRIGKENRIRELIMRSDGILVPRIRVERGISDFVISRRKRHRYEFRKNRRPCEYEVSDERGMSSEKIRVCVCWEF